MRNHVTLALFLVTVAGCGGVTSQDGQSDDSLTGHPIGNPCHVFNPGWISLDSVAARGLYGEPLVVEIKATSHQPYPGSGPDYFFHPIVLDGVGYSKQILTMWQSNLQQTTADILGAIVTPSMPGLHTVSLSSACGTETQAITVAPAAATAETPSLAVSATYVNPGTVVTLSCGSTPGATTCAEGRSHLVGKQDYDGKVVLDETYASTLYSWSKTVKPAIDTTYTLTTSCTLATYAAPQSITRHVQVYGGNGTVCGGAAPGVWQFCRTCPAALDSFPPWTSTLLEPGCSYADAKSGAQATGSNCTLSDGPCS
jgi:hypothetical protein